VIADESLNVLEDPKTRERIVGITTSPEMKLAIRDFAATFVEGGIDAAASEDVSERMRDAIVRLVEALAPALDRTARQVSSSASRGIASEIQTSLGPAMHRTLVTELSSPELRAVLAQLSSEMANAAVRGSKAGLLDLAKEREEAGKPSLTQKLTRSITAIAGGGFALGAASVLLLVWALRLRRRERRYRDAIMHALAERTGSPEGGGGGGGHDIDTLLDALAHT
jgi:hypothetical protein